MQHNRIPRIYREIFKQTLKENTWLKALALFLGILLSISTLNQISQESRITNIQSMTEEIRFEASPDKNTSDCDRIAKKNINLSNYVAVNGFRGLPVTIMNNNTPEYAEWNSKHPNTTATYSPRFEAITLRDRPRPYILTLRILQHEYGHRLWNKTLNDKDRNAYRNIYAESKEFVTIYSLTDTGEDFAESYSYYKLELPLTEARQTFMEELADKYPDEW